VEAIKQLIALGYPKSRFKIEAVVKKFGNSGRNSVRADFAVLDTDAALIPSGSVDELMDHAVLLCEVKRENSASDYVKHTQVKPLLDFAKQDACIGLYWDNVDQRVFWNERKKGKRVIREGPITLLPKYGRNLKVTPIPYKDTRAADSLLDIFSRIEDILHSAALDPEQRFHVILQILLAKIYDEHAHAGNPDDAVDIQDYRALGTSSQQALSDFNAVLKLAATFYQKFLPNRVEPKLDAKVTGDTLMDVAAIIAPIRITASKRDVVQAFYMKFAKGLYKWDLAQYFTPPTVTEYIVDILNPQFGEHIKDPACGSADFLTAAFHRRRDVDPGYAANIWGADNSRNAVQVAVLNMLLNGDGKTNIEEEDSLAKVDEELNQYQILVCNPPFGVRIKETRNTILRKFDLGHVWEETGGLLSKTDRLLDGQETGILFTELCVKQTVPGGRIGIILPNGYLGNRSQRYKVFREWLLRHCKLAAICSFPRFTFKGSGADVSASVVYLEKRKTVLKRAAEDKKTQFSVQMIENVGWNLGDKRAAPRYLRNEEDGSYIIGDDGNRVLDADFSASLMDLRSSAAASGRGWLTKGASTVTKKTGWAVPIGLVVQDADLTMDPKRYCRKVVELRARISTTDHVQIGDIVSIIPERQNKDGKRVKLQDKQTYKYVELQDIGYGTFDYVTLRGWQLPQRARHLAEDGDIYVGGIWGSVGKWCYIGAAEHGVVVTNGCHRLRMKPGKQKYLPDLLSFLCTEAYSVQARSLARGSDGLAEVSPDDLKTILIPQLSTAERDSIKIFVESLKAGSPDLRGKVAHLLESGVASAPLVTERPSHVVLV
jgi:type I restriction enzyme M protein